MKTGYRSSGIKTRLMAFLLVFGFSAQVMAQNNVKLSDEEVKNIVERSYQYVAMYNVNNKFALAQGGWNTIVADTQLKDHTMKDIARPNNDTLYVAYMVDLRQEPMILDIPSFDSKYVSLMITGYDHYVNVPMATRLGDFQKPEKMLLYSSRTEGYKGEAIKGVDRTFEATGDFVSAVFRVMPHANDKERFTRIVKQMQSVKGITLSEYQGNKAKPINDIKFPQVGKTDMDVFENNLLEVMQFVFNHVTFDPNSEVDQKLLDAYKPLGIVPGKSYDANKIAKIDGKRFREVAQQVQKAQFVHFQDTAWTKKHGMGLFKLKGEIPLHILILQSVIGPIGLPAVEAMYPAVVSSDGQPMNAQNDYVIHMKKADLPPAKAFWSLTMYDMQNGFFIPNEQKKYSVGENAGMKLNKEGGIDIYVAAKKPEGVPSENWLPINRKDENIDIILRVYVPDLEKMKTWQAPKAEKVK